MLCKTWFFHCALCNFFCNKNCVRKLQEAHKWAYSILLVLANLSGEWHMDGLPILPNWLDSNAVCMWWSHLCSSKGYFRVLKYHEQLWRAISEYCNCTAIASINIEVKRVYHLMPSLEGTNFLENKAVCDIQSFTTYPRRHDHKKYFHICNKEALILVTGKLPNLHLAYSQRKVEKERNFYRLLHLNLKSSRGTQTMKNIALSNQLV